MKRHIITIIACVAAAFTFVGCAHTTKQQVAVSIARDGTFAVAGKQCPPGELAARLTELAAKRHRAVVVHADAGAPLAQVAEVMDACKTAGVQRVSLATTK